MKQYFEDDIVIESIARCNNGYIMNKACSLTYGVQVQLFLLFSCCFIFEIFKVWLI
jgi:hypothetical protein